MPNVNRFFLDDITLERLCHRCPNLVGFKDGVGDIEEKQENYVRLDYTPSLFLYLDHSEFNTLDHLVHLEGYHRFRRLALTFSEDIQSAQSSSVETVSTSGTFINGSSVDAGGRRRLTSYGSRLNASYDLTGKTSLSVGGTYTATDYDNLINSQSLAGTVALDYHYGPKLTIGLAGTAGTNLVDECAEPVLGVGDGRGYGGE